MILFLSLSRKTNVLHNGPQNRLIQAVGGIKYIIIQLGNLKIILQNMNTSTFLQCLSYWMSCKLCYVLKTNL